MGRGRRSSRQRRESRQCGLPYRSLVSSEPRTVKRYFISQFLPTSSGVDVFPMRALHLAAVEIQRMARGRGLRRRFAGANWDAMSPSDRDRLARPGGASTTAPKADGAMVRRPFFFFFSVNINWRRATT